MCSVSCWPLNGQIYAIDACAPLAYNVPVIFIETPLFTKRITEIVSDEDYSEFQKFLAEHPEAGDVMEGTGGLRKVRMKLAGRGKSGGARVIYYHLESASQIRMVFVFKKDEQDNLTDDQKKQLKKIVENW